MCCTLDLFKHLTLKLYLCMENYFLIADSSFINTLRCWELARPPKKKQTKEKTNCVLLLEASQHLYNNWNNEAPSLKSAWREIVVVFKSCIADIPSSIWRSELHCCVPMTWGPFLLDLSPSWQLMISERCQDSPCVEFPVTVPPRLSTGASMYENACGVGIVQRLMLKVTTEGHWSTVLSGLNLLTVLLKLWMVAWTGLWH